MSSDLLAINVDTTCDNCAICTKFFKCTDAKRSNWIKEREKELRVSSLRAKMENIRHTIVVLSGKGGVGKSLVTVNLGAGLARKGRRVGVLDSDFSGPSIPKMLGVKERLKLNFSEGIVPAPGPLGMKVVSMGSILGADEPVLWRSDLKESAIEQLMGYVLWGGLDYLLIDLPPGTGDEAMNIFQLLPDISGAVMVTIPSEVSQIVVDRCVTLCKNAGIKVGIVENMSGFVCPSCGTLCNIFKSGGGERIAEKFQVGFLGKIPLDQRICESSDDGIPLVIGRYADSAAARMIMDIATKIDSW